MEYNIWSYLIDSNDHDDKYDELKDVYLCEPPEKSRDRAPQTAGLIPQPEEQ